MLRGSLGGLVSGIEISANQFQEHSVKFLSVPISYALIQFVQTIFVFYLKYIIRLRTFVLMNLSNPRETMIKLYLYVTKLMKTSRDKAIDTPAKNIFNRSYKFNRKTHLYKNGRTTTELKG